MYCQPLVERSVVATAVPVGASPRVEPTGSNAPTGVISEVAVGWEHALRIREV